MAITSSILNLFRGLNISLSFTCRIDNKNGLVIANASLELKVRPIKSFEVFKAWF